MKRKALLTALTGQYPEYSREELYALTVCGDVSVDGEVVRDPKRPVGDAARIRLERRDRYVSRAGDKLEKAVRFWLPPIRGHGFVDAGSSTGGFTDCLLAHGALAVHAVDVGFNQLDYRLRIDPRVIVHERTNIFSLQVGNLSPAADAAVADLSFRSIKGAAAHVLGLTRMRWMIALIKPQFETDSSAPGFDGIVRDDRTILEVTREVLSALELEGVRCADVVSSPVPGRRGNRELLALLWSGEREPDWMRARMAGERTVTLAARIRDAVSRVR